MVGSKTIFCFIGILMGKRGLVEKLFCFVFAFSLFILFEMVTIVKRAETEEKE